MRAPRWYVLVGLVVLAWLMVGSDCKDRPFRETQIVSFELTPNPVVRGGSVRVVWQAEHAGVYGGVPYCTLQRAVAGEPEEPLEVVSCVGWRVDVIDAGLVGGYIDYRFSALRRSGQAYETEVVRLVIAPLGVAVAPASVTLAPGGSQDFTATVTGASDTSVTWSTTCGSVSGSGSTITYTAPSSGGVCEVTATSVADPGVSATASVTVESATAIVRFEADAAQVTRGTPVTLTWEVTDSPDCSISRRYEGAEPDEPFAVACQGSLQESPSGPSDATYVRYQLNALKQPLDAADPWITAVVTVYLDDPEPRPMLLDVDTNLIAGTTVTLPLRGAVDVSIDWGDGTVSRVTSEGERAYTYASDGIYTISITGTLDWFGGGSSEYPHAAAITGVSAWGDLGLIRLWGAFRNATNLTSVPDDLPNGATDLDSMFRGAVRFNHPLDTWNTSAVSDMRHMFDGASAFNQPLNGWDTSSVLWMQAMFLEARAFNHPLGNWNTSSVIGMHGMFLNASSFNRDLSSWCVTNITSQPLDFDDGATSWTLPRPIWGTCPSGSE